MLSNDSASSSEYAVSCNSFDCSDFQYFLTKILKRQRFCLFDIRGVNIKIKQTFQVVGFVGFGLILVFFCLVGCFFVRKAFITFYMWTQPSGSNSYKVSEHFQLF